jgi:hypothetical protein
VTFLLFAEHLFFANIVMRRVAEAANLGQIYIYSIIFSSVGTHKIVSLIKFSLNFTLLSIAGHR